MKRIISVLLAALTLLLMAACGQQASGSEAQSVVEPKASQMKSICELATMECYYHNVAKYKEENAEGVLWWKKDKVFWIEYSGVVKIGIDASLVNIVIDADSVSITLPEATVLSCRVDSSSLNQDSYIVAKDSAAITAEDEVYSFSEAQKQLEDCASNDRALLAEAQQRAQELLEDYITNIGNAVGKEYTIHWVYLNNSTSPAVPMPAASAVPETTAG